MSVDKSWKRRLWGFVVLVETVMATVASGCRSMADVVPAEVAPQASSREEFVTRTDVCRACMSFRSGGREGVSESGSSPTVGEGFDRFDVKESDVALSGVFGGKHVHEWKLVCGMTTAGDLWESFNFWNNDFVTTLFGSEEARNAVMAAVAVGELQWEDVEFAAHFVDGSSTADASRDRYRRVSGFVDDWARSQR